MLQMRNGRMFFRHARKLVFSAGPTSDSASTINGGANNIAIVQRQAQREHDEHGQQHRQRACS